MSRPKETIYRGCAIFESSEGGSNATWSWEEIGGLGGIAQFADGFASLEEAKADVDRFIGVPDRQYRHRTSHVPYIVLAIVAAGVLGLLVAIL